jgi:hypothetical protein
VNGLVLALLLRILRASEPQAHLAVTIESAERGHRAFADTDSAGIVRFVGLEPGSYFLKVESAVVPLVLTAETETLTFDLTAPPISNGRFGRFDIARSDLERLPHADTVSNLLETIEPFAITDRIDVAGIEGTTDPRWSLRGSSWTQNRVLLDGIDITDPAGGAPLLYPELAFFEEISLRSSANPPEVAGPGAELNLVSRALSSSLGGSAVFRYSGAALQSENLDESLARLGVEPREMVSFPSGRFEVGGPAFFAAVNAFELATRVPHFDAEERTTLVAGTGKLAKEGWSLLGIAQGLSRPRFGARPRSSVSSTVDADEEFQVLQGGFDPGPYALRFGFARGAFDSKHSGERSPVRDLATSEIGDAPLRVVDRTRSRLGGVGVVYRTLGRHDLRAGFELSRGHDETLESVPGSMERLTVDGAAHAVSIADGEGRTEVSASRIALHLQDSWFFDLFGRPFRIAPAARFDLSRSESIHWASLSGVLAGGVLLAPSTELHFSLGRYPHVLTTRFAAVDEGLSFTWRRWEDGNFDLEADPEEIGSPLRRRGGEWTTIDANLPRPHTHELTIGVERRFARGFLRFSGYQRWESGLLQTVNAGIAPESYATFPFVDVGLDGVAGTADDNELGIYDQHQELGSDLFRLTHPDGLDSYAQGVDLLLSFRHGRVAWSLSGRAYRDVGQGNVGNEPFENDTGIPGDLFDDPNTLTHSEGRLFFDRAFTGKIALTARGPKALDIGAAVRYWDGQPFARHLFFDDLGQGFTVVQALPRGRARLAFNMTVDVRVEREFSFGRWSIGLAFDAFNLFNQTRETGEVVRTGETYRDPTFVQPARTLALQARIRF